MLRLKAHIIFLCSVLFFSIGYSQSPPQIVVSGNQLFCSDSPMPIVTGISISNGSGSLDVLYIQISQGYTNGEDVLVLTGSHPNISSTWSNIEGLLTLSGTASYTEYEAAIEEVVFLDYHPPEAPPPPKLPPPKPPPNPPLEELPPPKPPPKPPDDEPLE